MFSAIPTGYWNDLSANLTLILGVIRFGKRRKLSPRYIGPFKIFESVGPVAYKLELPEELQVIHNTFHVSNLKKCLANEKLVISLNEIRLDDKLHFIKEPAEIVDPLLSFDIAVSLEANPNTFVKRKSKEAVKEKPPIKLKPYVKLKVVLVKPKPVVKANVGNKKRSDEDVASEEVEDEEVVSDEDGDDVDERVSDEEDTIPSCLARFLVRAFTSSTYEFKLEKDIISVTTQKVNRISEVPLGGTSKYDLP
nr:reverse transcriptase domain-containing protein [Tanacetum cinerariifolium]